MNLTLHQAEFKERVTSELILLGATEISFSVVDSLQVWRFEFRHKNVVWPLKLISERWSFAVLPSIYWDTNVPKWAWPHISKFGDICISDREGLDYDSEDIGGVCSWVLYESLKILIKNSELTFHQRAVEFADELEGYLQNLSIPKVPFDDVVGTETRLYAEVSYKKIAFGSLPCVRRVNIGSTVLPKCQQEALERIDVDILQIPAIEGKTITKDWWTHLCTLLTPSERERVQCSQTRGVFFRVKNAYGFALFIIHWGKHVARRPFGSIYLVQRQDIEYLIKRTGQIRTRKKVVVVGCGSVGSRVAEHLALAAVTKITLIDDDVLLIDNVGRHVLGKLSVGRHKTEALAASLSDRVPGLEIISIPKRVDSALTAEIILDSDVIILATGNAPVEREIIRKAYKEKWQSLIISASVEAGGLGGHAISMRSDVSGCLECLYIDPDTLAKTPWMRGALIKSGQKVTRQLTGCASFTPYSSLDAAKTAILAVELALSDAVGYKRWVGDGKLALSSNITPSGVHELLLHHRTPMYLEAAVYAQGSCLCCSA